MNKTFIITVAMACLATVYSKAQNLVDAERFGESTLSGTARYRSMAGAFGALGGDPSCMSDNPAGIAIYRGTNVFTITPHLSFTGTSSKGSEKGTDKRNNFAISNCSAIFSLKTESNDNLVNFNLGLGFERRYENFSKTYASLDLPTGSFGNYLKNQANNYLGGKKYPSSAFDWDNTSTQAPILSMIAYNCYAIDDNPNDDYSVVDPMEGSETYQQLSTNEYTRQDNFNISAAWNFNDMFYLGATMVITDFNSTIESSFDEDYDYYYQGSYIEYNNKLETKGSGVGLNLGLLWTPIDNWRLGAAVHTPVWTTMTEFCEGEMTTDDDRLSDDDCWVGYNDSWKYNYRTPWEYQFSTAYVFGTKGLISLEYDLRDFTTMRYSQNRDYSLSWSFDTFNNAIKYYMKAQHTFKVGAEYRLTSQVSARAGYAFITSPYKDSALYANVLDADQNTCYYSMTKPNFSTLGSQYYATCGLGWRGVNWYTDFAFMYHHTKNHIAAYPNDFSDCTLIDVAQAQKNFDLTIGYRF